MNTGADVSYLLKARQALKESEDAERAGNAGLARDRGHDAIGWIQLWTGDIHGKQCEKEAA